MAELADALDLGSSGVTRTGSIPASRTIQKMSILSIFFYYFDIHIYSIIDFFLFYRMKKKCYCDIINNMEKEKEQHGQRMPIIRLRKEQ